MLFLAADLKQKICSRINPKQKFCAIQEVNTSEDCSCKGACGTYTPPCACCAYN